MQTHPPTYTHTYIGQTHILYLRLPLSFFPARKKQNMDEFGFIDDDETDAFDEELLAQALADAERQFQQESVGGSAVRQQQQQPPPPPRQPPSASVAQRGHDDTKDSSKGEQPWFGVQRASQHHFPVKLSHSHGFTKGPTHFTATTTTTTATTTTTTNTTTAARKSTAVPAQTRQISVMDAFARYRSSHGETTTTTTTTKTTAPPLAATVTSGFSSRPAFGANTARSSPTLRMFQSVVEFRPTLHLRFPCPRHSCHAPTCHAMLTFTCKPPVLGHMNKTSCTPLTAMTVPPNKHSSIPSRSTSPTMVDPANLRPSCPHPFDSTNILTSIYPTNYPVRDYQYNIVQHALYHNTLVSLPTGLGKTFIAAVVMFNYWRWFPQGKIVFMAPTKPLVAQQIEACHKIVGISQEETVELTGAQQPESRAASWKNKRLFFLTPQVMQNDMQRGSCPVKDLVCLVVDEAHRATRNYAYCTVVREVSEMNRNFRILALSATPGADVSTVQDVVNNLRIGRIEIRTEESMDIRQYTHNREKEIIVVPLGDQITAIQKMFCVDILQPTLSRLKRCQAFYNGDPMQVNGYTLLAARGAWRQKTAPTMDRKAAGSIERDFALLISLYHAFDLLVKHGITPFHNYLADLIRMDPDGACKNAGVRKELMSNPGFDKMMQYISTCMRDPVYMGHPKIGRLENIVLSHFLEHNEQQTGVAEDSARQTRVMIFSEYRDSVEEIVKILNRHAPLLRVMQFVGQASKNGKGFSQKEQLEVIEKFQNGDFNVLVATSIGEEGLDIGDIDMILCFDSQSSPVRMLQRMGRTGRKRDGKIVVLLSEGKEQQKYNKTQSQYKAIQKAIMNQGQGGRSGSTLTMVQEEPRMIPFGMRHPSCIQMKIQIPDFVKLVRKGGAKKGSAISEDQSSSTVQLSIAQEVQYQQLFGREPTESFASLDRKLDLSRHIHWQCVLQKSHVIGHGFRSKMFVDSILKSTEYVKESMGAREEGKSEKEIVSAWEKKLFQQAPVRLIDAYLFAGSHLIDDGMNENNAAADDVGGGAIKKVVRRRKRKPLLEIKNEAPHHDSDDDDDGLVGLPSIVTTKAAKSAADEGARSLSPEYDISPKAPTRRLGGATSKKLSNVQIAFTEDELSSAIFDHPPKPKRFSLKPFVTTTELPKTPAWMATPKKMVDIPSDGIMETMRRLPPFTFTKKQVKVTSSGSRPTAVEIVHSMMVMTSVFGNEATKEDAKSESSSQKQSETAIVDRKVPFVPLQTGTPESMPGAADFHTTTPIILDDLHDEDPDARCIPQKKPIAPPVKMKRERPPLPDPPLPGPPIQQKEPSPHSEGQVIDADETFCFDDDHVLLDLDLDAIVKDIEEKNPAVRLQPAVLPMVKSSDKKKRLSLKLKKGRSSPIILDDHFLQERIALPSSPLVNFDFKRGAISVAAPTPASAFVCAPVPAPTPATPSIRRAPHSGIKSGRKSIPKDLIFSSPSEASLPPKKALRRLRRGARPIKLDDSPEAPKPVRNLRKSTIVVRKGSEHIAKLNDKKDKATVLAAPKAKKKKKHATTSGKRMRMFYDMEADVSEGSCSEDDGTRRRYRLSQDDNEDALDESYRDDPELRGFVVDDEDDDDDVYSSPPQRLPDDDEKGGRAYGYKMKFHGAITLSQKYAPGNTHKYLYAGESEEGGARGGGGGGGGGYSSGYEQDSFIVGSDEEEEAFYSDDDDATSSVFSASQSVASCLSAQRSHQQKNEPDGFMSPEVRKPLAKRRLIILDDASQSVTTPVKKFKSFVKTPTTGDKCLGPESDQDESIFKRPQPKWKTPARPTPKLSNTPGTTMSAATHSDMELPNFSLGFRLNDLLDGVDFNDFEDDLEDAENQADVTSSTSSKATLNHLPSLTDEIPKKVRNVHPLNDENSKKIQNVPPPNRNFSIPTETVPQVAADGRLTVLIDGRELKTPICSLLRNKYKMNTVIRQLSVADYVLSNRMGVERKSRSGT